MSSAGHLLQTAIVAALESDSALAALVGDRVYDHSPAGAIYPHITFGPSDETPEDADCLVNTAYNWQIDTWSQTGGNRIETRNLTAAIKKMLHGADLDLDPYALALLDVVRVRILGDSNPLLTHGVVEIYAEIEDPT